MEIEGVLEFLHKNEFREAESALKEDIIEKGLLGSYEFEKFLFPMPPPLSIPGTFRESEADDTDDGERSSTTSSNDEFMSLESLSTSLHNSEFANPYAISSPTEASSDASSDRMSQFGSARAYNDFGSQNDLYWYNDLDEGNFMTPSFRASDPFGCASEDKFVTSSEVNKQYFVNPMCIYDNPEEFQSETGIEHLDKPCLFRVASLNGVNEVKETDFYDFKKDSQGGECFEGQRDGCSDYDCLKPLCRHGSDAGSFCGEDPVDNECLIDLSDIKLKVVRKDSDNFEFIINKGADYFMQKGSMNGCVEASKGLTELRKAVEMFSFPNGDCEAEYHKTANRGCHDMQAITGGEGIHDDEQWLCDMHEDEYEVFDLRIIHRRSRTGFEENKDLPIVLNTIIAGRYYLTEYLGSAAFSKVVQAHDLVTGMDVCLKIIKNDKDFFDQSLDEIKLLKLVNKYDPADERHILRLYDYFYHKEHLFIVCELLRANLYEFQRFNQESGGEAYFTLSRLQVITGQVLEALDYLHGLGIIHCDLKPENILIKSYRKCEIKVIDLGSSCFQTDNLSLYVQSRSYRAPEVILGLPYDEKIDLWSLGCVLAELYSGEVLFPNDAIPMILARMIGLVGPIDAEMLENGQEVHKYFTKECDLYHIIEETNQLEYIIPESSSLEHHLQVTDNEFIDFLRCLLKINPKWRPTASEALQHPWLAHSY